MWSALLRAAFAVSIVCFPLLLDRNVNVLVARKVLRCARTTLIFVGGRHFCRPRVAARADRSGHY
jgi:hypothetical protein